MPELSENASVSRNWRARVDWLRERASTPVKAAPIVYFRVVFGLILFWEVTRYWRYGWIERYYVEPTLFFSYPGFEWVHPWPGAGMYMHFAVLGVLALAFAAGLAYRLSATLLALGFWYVFLLDQANYLNHFYLMGLVASLMALVPAAGSFSVDAVLNPRTRSTWVPAWSAWVLRFQLGIAYFYGGIAKLNGDWLQGSPMDLWMPDAAEAPLLAGFVELEAAPLLLSWGGLLFDLMIVPALLWRPTRLLAILGTVTFHLTNAQLFSIGVFPWFMLLATPIFFPLRTVSDDTARAHGTRMPVPLFVFLVSWVSLQLTIPLRHHLYPGDVAWTEEGHMFSWRMKLRDKQGKLTVWAHDQASGRSWQLDPSDYLSPRQLRKMKVRPQLIAQFARKVAPIVEREEGVDHLRITAEARVSLNGRVPALLVDPEANLVAAKEEWPTSSWITRPQKAGLE